MSVMSYWTEERKVAYRERTGCTCPVWLWDEHQVVAADGAFRGCRVHRIYAAYWQQFARIS